MNQGQQPPPAPQAQQQAPPAPQAQPAIAAAPPVLPAPPPPAVPAPPAPAFALGPRRSHAVLDYDDPQYRGHCDEILQQGHFTPRRKIRRGSGQPGSVPGQCARQGTTVQLASPDHGANRRWDDEKFTYTLRASVFGKHQGTRNDLRQHAYA